MWQMPARCNMASLIPGRIVEMFGAGFGGVVESAGAGAGGVAVGETDCVVGATVSSLMCGVFSVLLCVFICGVFCVLLLCFVDGGVRERLSVICGFGGLAIKTPHLHPS